MTDLLQIPLTDINGQETRLADYGARALLVVNTASRCGFMPGSSSQNSASSQPNCRALAFAPARIVSR